VVSDVKLFSMSGIQVLHSEKGEGRISLDDMRGELGRKFEIINTLASFVRCAQGIIYRERIVVVGCNEVSELTSRTLRKLGYEPVVYSAFVDSKAEKRRVGHTWVEVNNYVVETNPSQILGAGRYVAFMPRKNWEHLTKPSVREINPEGKSLVLTETGEKYYNKISDELAKCTTRGGV